MVATISLIILAIVCGLAWMNLAARPDRGARPGAGRTAVRGPESADAVKALASDIAGVSVPMELAQASAPRAVPGPVRGKVVPFPARSSGRNAVHATAQGSRSLYVYWEAATVGDEQLRAVLGEADWRRTTPCLRVFDITVGGFPGQAGGRTLIVELPKQADHHIISDGIQPGHRYVVSYERCTEDGQHYLLSQSAPVSLPPDGPPAERTLHRLHARRPGKWSGTP
jgi:hypothetical protein